MEKKNSKLNIHWWKKIKANGNERKKRRELINNMVSNNFREIPRRKPMKPPESVQVTSVLVSSAPENVEKNTQNELQECSESDNQNQNWNTEMDESNFSELNTEIDSEEKRSTIIEDLREWSGQFCIKHNALNGLLALLNKNVPEFALPKDSRTVMATPRKKCEINEDGFGGSYWHYGLENALTNCLANVQEDTTIKININVDGLPLFKSSRFEFWPILVSIHKQIDIAPMVVGIYYGKGKPKDVNWFMKPFVDEFLSINEKNGIHINGQKVVPQIRSFICDTPARHYLKGVISSNGYFGCLMCETKGKYSHTARTMIYTDINAELRTNEKFRSGVYTDHCKLSTVLRNLPIDMIKDFPVADSLHLIDLGITKRFLNGWKSGNLNNHKARWSIHQANEVSAFLERCKLPKEFDRPVRGLSDLAHWKGTEYRTFMLYLSIVVVKKFFVDPKISQHFLLFYCAVVICMRHDQCEESYKVAELMFKDFLINFKALYGIDHFSSNLHNVCHIVNDVRKFGPLDTFSAYAFESKLYYIKRLLRLGRTPLSQVARRISERQSSGVLHKVSSKIKTPQVKYPMEPFATSNSLLASFILAQKATIYSQVQLPTFILDCKKNENRWILNKSFQIVYVKYIIKTFAENPDLYLYGPPLSKISDYFEYPMRSSELNIYQSDCIMDSPIFVSVSDIYCKLVRVEYNLEKSVFIPLLHTIEEKQ
ncbi:uncharacterized protein LOC129909036 isoform X1 [Episyrphus balteatus]|uniref:uncharacterized protein LOC129909036 isoform X1 n=1 Tax=Episyrphus balteatus TaxID=286459 RepID=UPI0024850EDE|nr:uncharacterized protein LOC129909036 isoform X1 [Episyrphus balteatus]